MCVIAGNQGTTATAVGATASLLLYLDVWTPLVGDCGSWGRWFLDDGGCQEDGEEKHEEDVE
jgi:hypothetical protein